MDKIQALGRAEEIKRNLQKSKSISEESPKNECANELVKTNLQCGSDLLGRLKKVLIEIVKA